MLTCRRAKQHRWDNLRLPTELMNHILTPILSEHIHRLFMEDGPIVKTKQRRSNLVGEVRSKRRSSNAIKTLLHVCRQYRSVAAGVLVKLFYAERENADVTL